MPSTLDAVRDLLETRRDEVAEIVHGWRAGPRVQGIVDGLKRDTSKDQPLKMREDNSLPYNKVRVIGTDKSVLSEFDL